MTAFNKTKTDTEVYVYQTLKDTNYNGGWNHIGNGNTQTTLYIEKDGVSLSLDDGDITKILQGLKPFHGRL